MNNEAKVILNIIKQNVGNFQNSMDIIRLATSFVGLTLLTLSFLITVVVFSVFDVELLLIIVFYSSAILSLIFSIIYFCDLKESIGSNKKVVKLFILTTFKSIFIKNKYTQNTVYANFLYHLFLYNNIIDVFSIIDNLTSVRKNEFYIIKSVVFSYIHNNYKRFNKKESELAIDLIGKGKITYNHAMKFDKNEFHEFFCVLEEYEQNRSKRELSINIQGF